MRSIIRGVLICVVALIIVTLAVRGPGWYRKWLVLNQIANSDCKYLFESKFGLDTENTQDGNELRPTHRRIYALLFECVWALDYSKSQEPAQQILKYAEVVGNCGQVSVFVVSDVVENEISIPILQDKLQKVALAVDKKEAGKNEADQRRND